jgi:hypothetical protein
MMREAKVTCPHCGKPIVVRDKPIDQRIWAQFDKVFEHADKMFAHMDRMFAKLRK